MPEKKIPEFEKEAAERSFWAEKDSADFIDWTKAETIVLPKLKLTSRKARLVLPTFLLAGWAFAAWAEPRAFDPLAPLLFLVGSWQGEGTSPSGPCELEAVIERRGRWLSIRASSHPPGQPARAILSTGVLGLDAGGEPVMVRFDDAGSTTFTGRIEEGRLVLEGGPDNVRHRLVLTPRNDGTIHSLAEVRHAGSTTPSVFENVYRRAPRP